MEKARKKLLAAAALAAAGATATAVLAITGIPGAALADPEPGQHCVQNANTGERRCFGNFDEAIAFANGQATDVPEEAPEAENSGAIRAQVDEPSVKAAGEVIVGTVFSDADYGGNSLTIVGPTLCKKDGVVNWQYDLPDDWKNQITSVQAWGDCWLWLYPEPGLNGDRDGPFKENTPNIGDFMNDRTQSIGFS